MGEAGAQNHPIQRHLEFIHHGQYRDLEPSHRGKSEHLGGHLIKRICYSYLEGHFGLDPQAQDNAPESRDMD
jgi:hypothetical protein